MSVTGNATSSFRSARAALESAYEDAAERAEEIASDELPGVAEGASAEGIVDGQPAADVSAGAGPQGATDGGEVGTEAAGARTDAATPYRVFADEAAYRHFESELTARERAAQAAADKRAAELERKFQEVSQENTALVRARNEIYDRMQRDALAPADFIEVHQRRENESKAEFAAREREQQMLRVAQEQEERTRQDRSGHREAVAETAMLRAAMPLIAEHSDVKGFDVAATYREALLTDPECQRLAKISYYAVNSDGTPDTESRKWAAEQSYKRAAEAVLKQGATLRKALAPKAAPAALATSVPAATSGGSNPLAGITSAKRMLDHAYSR